ncbi:HAD family hydrolase [Hydrogenophaga sp. MI9]|uniref:HAD family hydrolase n=1 Tax=Hydrogenophaga sp. MI9 TaxID=3453719 RepID=UPI003EED4179
MKQNVVVFDLGGVVFNWQPTVLLRQVLPARAVDEASAQHWVREIFQAFDPDGIWSQFDLGHVTPEELAMRVARRTGLAVDEVAAVIDGLAPHMRVKDDTVALIHELKAAGHRLVYLSNMPHGLSHWIEDDHPFADWFEDGIFSARVALIKPDPAIFRLTVERLGVRDPAPVFIDDAQRNIDAAHALGWRGVRFETAGHVRAQLVNSGLLPV